MPLQQTSGNVTSDAFGGGVAAEVNYIESVFSTYLYTGTGASQTITNGIDLSTKGGLVWIKGRSGATDHRLTDTARGVTKSLASNSSAGEATETTGLTAFGTTGFTIGADADYNTSADTYASWSFRKQPKFFDIQTWSGDSTARTIAHNLGSVPGCIMVKRIDATAQNWNVYHQSLGNEFRIALDTTSAAVNIGNACWNSTTPTSTVFSLGTNSGVNASGGTYEAYLFAHDAGGFGLTGTDNVISCGSFTADGGGSATVSLGYEPQWVMVKSSSTTGAWLIFDTMRGLPVTGSNCLRLSPNANTIEASGTQCYINSTGFGVNLQASTTYIYIAIRRGPMKVPTDATKVFLPTAFTSNNSSSQVISVGFPSDMALVRERTTTANYASNWPIGSRLTGNGFLRTTLTNAEVTFLDMVNGWDDQNSIDLAGIIVGNGNYPEILYNFQRAPSFFDEVCYSGTGSVGNAISHNLGVAPELAIFKGRTGLVGASNWSVFTQFTGTNYVRAFLQTTDAGTTYPYTINAGMAAVPTSTTITVDNVANLNNGSTTYVAYLFASAPGVSKVGTYTGNGTTQTINCGFTGGARFVLIKATSTTGDWLTFDTARGMTVLTDPVLSLNSTAAETATLGACTTVSTGFALNESILTGVNTNSVSFVFLAIA